jgi:ABC-2 type transport system ATP-binding protein
MAGTIRVQNLSKRYGDLNAAAEVSFATQDSEIFGLLGPNGAGKTTVLECVLGLRQPDGGQIEIDGINALAHPRQIKGQIGAQLQATALPDAITPREALRLFAAFYSRRAAVNELIERFSLTEKADARFDSLSAGQRQRLALALAFVNDPRILFLDEPTAGLDPHVRRELHEDILQMRRDGRTVILSTHHIDEAQTLCDHVAILNHGRIIAVGTPAELTARAGSAAKIVVKTMRPVNESAIASLGGVQSIRARAGAWEIATTTVGPTIAALMRALDADQNELIDLHVVKPSLEDVFIELTQCQ